MGYFVALGFLLLFSLLANNPELFLVLIPVVLIAILARIRARRIEVQERFQRDQLFKAQAEERAEQSRLDAIESRRIWDIEVGKQQQSRMERVNRVRENYGIVSEVCGICSSDLNAKGICISGCKPLEE
jgi:hypothetical protein